MTRTALGLALLALLLAAAPAAAKGVEDPRVCGTDACVPVPMDADMYLAFEGAEPTAAPAAREPHLELRYGIFEGVDTIRPVTTRFLPRAGLILAEDATWRRPPDSATAELRRLARGLERFGARPRTLAAEAPGGPSPLLLAGLGAVALAGVGTGVGRHRRAAARG